MKSFTNYMPGLRGINTDNGTIWIEPGQTVEVDPKSIKGALPDLGKAPSGDDDATDLDALKDQVADLAKQVEALEADKAELAKAGADLAKDKADLAKQVEALKKSAR